MFFGESLHSLDAKHRVCIPKRFQDVLAKEQPDDSTVVLTRGFENCLFLFSSKGFETVLERLRLQPFGEAELRNIQRLFFANTVQTQLDGSGRLLLPEKLRRLAGLEKEVVLVGVADRAEIWSKDAWERFEESNSGQYDSLSEVLCGQGVLPPPPT